ncbi:hypothetical protein GCM10007304_33940 [Rhodococcoides trifolii]|uniref:LppP/LprE family lipoprotein n=1 Tax=Rhodococcoides trifolii TaxID=908250 RepID=A0A917G0L8_9NOCA|nr:LppP/LprE family lipoprotein [Rhodococcus trifolii]GGG16979.1 hypothetical protein GCM10007304_33940 [Rhodococcus trifolii]
MGISTGIVKTAALAACAVAAVSCSGGNTGTPQSASTTTPSATVTTLPPLTRTSAAQAPSAETQTETVTVPAGQPAQPAQVVPCVDPSSDNVRAAVGRLGTDSQGGPFQVIGHTGGNSADGCPTLEWALAQGTGIQDATSQYHVLFFTNKGNYLGTATSYAYSYTDVVKSTDSSVTVHYKWLSPDDPFCCPSNESYVDFTLNGNTITPSGQFPPKP